MSLHYLRQVVTLQYDSKKCNGCGRCAEVCPHAVFSLHDGRAVLLERDDCMECGACARNCARGAITVKAGVGCAAAVIQSRLRGTPVECGCSTEKGCC